MKSLLAIAAALLLSMNSANAQSTDEVAVNTTSKSQLQKIEDFNNRAKVEVKVFLILQKTCFILSRY